MRATLSLLLLLAGNAALAAGPDAAVAISGPAAVHLYETGRYTVSVSNAGTRDASSVGLTIDLPRTHTSPQIYPMGYVLGFSAGCTRSGTTLSCALGALRKGRSTSVWVDLALPQSSAPLVLTATATTAGDTNASNNTRSLTAALLAFDQPVGAPKAAHHRHCTGTGLTAFFECTLFPSSIAAHDTTLNADGSITFTEPGYTGAWTQTGTQDLAFTYSDGTGVVASFSGVAVDASSGCFEGLTTFPGSAWVSPYEVCLH